MNLPCAHDAINQAHDCATAGRCGFQRTHASACPGQIPEIVMLFIMMGLTG